MRQPLKTFSLHYSKMLKRFLRTLSALHVHLLSGRPCGRPIMHCPSAASMP